ncbi:putative transmembrane protein [Gregarina niphandrodes]|uniref:Man(5)GlcNAc(2)-PP-dolichol translocation protein RFT1 n=1 Tax=Gregarina niphandrodes TaxID=110365 RepID=A0A023AZ04_GRENI|nr:putative transmembrane protein [Gregarina niphandrodes]EZG43545.1 putative transmembrane protein [Gregarina niphandrodes]|eukprot:XP_011133230.1 putative transmembrane protein [Gregarina niphandrodes]
MNVIELWVYSFGIKVTGLVSNVILVNAVSLEAYGLQNVTISFISNSLSWIRAEFGRTLLQKNINAPETFTALSLLAVYLTCGLAAVIWCVGSMWIPRVAASFVRSYVSSLALYSAAAVIDSLTESGHVTVCATSGGIEFIARLESQSQAATNLLTLFTVTASRIVCPSSIDRNYILAGAVCRLLSSIWQHYKVGRYYLAKERRLDEERQEQVHHPFLLELNGILKFKGKSLRQAKKAILCEGRNSLQKFITVEGDKLAMMRLSGRTVGAIGSAQTLGSIVVRVFFAPTEAGIRAHYCLFDKYETINLHSFKEATKLQVSLGALSTLFGFYFAVPALRVIRGTAFKYLESEALAYHSLLLLPLSVSGLTDGILHVVDKTGTDYGLLQSIVFAAWLLGASSLWLTSGSSSNKDQVVHWFVFTGFVQLVRLFGSIHILGLRLGFGLGLRSAKGTLDNLFHPISRKVTVFSLVWGIVVLPVIFRIVRSILEPIVLFNRVDVFPCGIGLVSASLMFIQIRSIALRSQ